MASGYMLRQTQAALARAAAPCPMCSHANGQHHELPRETLRLEGDRIVADPNPAYRPLRFHCDHGACDCVIDRSEDG
jgi:hypothetical protein